ncbi:MAG: hypothetical protein NZ583_04035 [Desulfobacterota bacterium]|nr:hypothetical protein [Thermodesulfobacteriota bacterium]MDW8001562.1 hypothetical protein [Deltaproteobacteria bacterium]
MVYECPGVANIKTPTLEIRDCPNCGAEIEIASIDFKATCRKCGFTIYNDLNSCVEYCQYAKECLGEDLYNAIKKGSQE